MPKVSLRALFGAAVTASVLAAGVASASDGLRLSNKWRIEVSEGANNSGTIAFRVTPKEGTPIDVSVQIQDGRSENGVAVDIRKALEKALDPKVYDVERDDGEDVLVKKHKGPDFELKLVESTVKGTRINVEKE
jgi:hypothetical protein